MFSAFIHVAEGNKKVITVVYNKCNDNLSINGSETLRNDVNCSFDEALANLTDNTEINITTDVLLSRIISVTNYTNISIIGHHNPIVKCNKHGGLNFVSCHNCTIEGITLEGCGAGSVSGNNNYLPAIQLINSFNVTFKHCSFQHSIGQALVLSGISGEVTINHCNFLYNNQYKGHGTAIHYSSNAPYVLPLKLTIENCILSYNGGSESVVYLGQSVNTTEYLYL